MWPQGDTRVPPWIRVSERALKKTSHIISAMIVKTSMFPYRIVKQAAVFSSAHLYGIITVWLSRSCSHRLWWRWPSGTAGVSWWKCRTAAFCLQSKPGERLVFGSFKILNSRLTVYPPHLSPSQGLTNSWLRVIPKTKFGAFARGAKVVLYTKKSGPHTRIIDGGSGYLCEMEPVAHFGLGEFSSQLADWFFCWDATGVTFRSENICQCHSERTKYKVSAKPEADLKPASAAGLSPGCPPSLVPGMWSKKSGGLQFYCLITHNTLGKVFSLCWLHNTRLLLQTGRCEI